MSEYRIYVLDDSRHVRSGLEIEATDDDEAVQAAAIAAPEAEVEVWKLDRFLCRFDLVRASATGDPRLG